MTTENDAPRNESEGGLGEIDQENRSRQEEPAKGASGFSEEAIAKFWKKVIVRKDISKCWWWKGAGGGQGYGAITMDGRTWAAHRVSWVINCGPIPGGLFVCHRCDQPQCVNFNHLFLGTNEDNMQDAVIKGRRKKWVRPIHTEPLPPALPPPIVRPVAPPMQLLQLQRRQRVIKRRTWADVRWDDYPTTF